MISRYKLLAALLLLTQLCGLHVFSQTAPQPKAAPAKLFFEKAYLHTDRDYYSTGEDIWFKAYLVDAQTNMPIGISNNLYVELLSPDAKTVNAETVYMVNGLGKGDIKLADSISAGTYRLRAYTNWMRNFGDNFIFEKTLTISNTLITKDAGSMVSSVLSGKGGAASGATGGKPVLRFFPEGGSMVNDVAGVVAFKAEDPNGKNVSVKAAIFSSTGDTVTHFTSTAAGIGSFVFVPEANKTYTVKGVFNNNQQFTTALPVALAKGYVIHVSDADSAHIRIIVSTNQATMADNPDKEITVTGRHTGQRFLNGPLKFEALQTFAVLAKNQLPAGVSSVTVYDKQLHPQCERLIYIPDSMSAKTLTIKTDKQAYHAKEKVTLTIRATDPKQSPVKANLSVAVVDAGAVPAGQGNIASYLLLQSEIRGKIDHPERYFDKTNPNRFKQIDLLLMTQGWRDFVWQRLADTSIRISYPAENGFGIAGNVREKFGSKPLPNTNVSLTVKGAVVGQQYLARTDNTGKYSFSNISVTGDRPVVLASFDDNRKKVGWIQIDTTQKTLPAVSPVRLYAVDTAGTMAFINQDVVRSKTRTRLSDTLKLKEVKINSNANSNYTNLLDQMTTKFGYPDLNYTITPKSYFYNSLRDYLIHEVPGARTNEADSVVFRGGKFDVEKNRETNQDILPRFIVNNREDVDDLNNGLYLNLTMDKINKVTVRHVLGQTSVSPNSSGTYVTGTGGDVYIIFLDIKPDAFNKTEFNTASTHISGYYEARNFYKPVYDTAKDLGKQDIRNTIHWEPNVVTDANGEATLTFYNADPKGNISIRVEGLTDKGAPVFGTWGYVVK